MHFNSQKYVSGAYDIQHFLVLVSRDLLLIALYMHYAKFTLWTPKLQILAKTLLGNEHVSYGFEEITCYIASMKRALT